MSMVDPTSLDAVLQEYYTREKIQEVGYEDNALWAIFPKKMDCGGRRYIQPIQYGVPAGRSRNFSTAQANKTSSKYMDFVVPWVDDFGEITITRKAMKETSGDEAFVDAQIDSVNDMLKTLTRSAAISMYRGSGGARGQIVSTYSSTTTFTLQATEEITNFEVGDNLVFSANNGNTSTDTLIAGSAADPATITNIDRDAGTITVDSSTYLSASRYIFLEGDFQASFTGILGWIPTAAPTAGESFLGNDRSVDVTRCAGSRITTAGLPVREAITNGLARLAREGGKPDIVPMNYRLFKDLQVEMDNKVNLTEYKVGNIGFESFSFIGSNQKVTVIADINCPDGVIPILKKSSWKVVSMGDIPELVDEDGSKLCRSQTASAFDVRGEYYGNVVCESPKENLVINFS